MQPSAKLALHRQVDDGAEPFQLSLFLDVVACACTESTSKAMERRQSAAGVTDPTRLLARTVLWNKLHEVPIKALVLANASFVCVGPLSFVPLCCALFHIVPYLHHILFCKLPYPLIPGS